MPIYPGMNFELTAQGRLQISTFSNGIAKPAVGTTVCITPRGSDNVIEEIITDSSGQSPIIDLPAPPLDFSMNPETQQRPYSEYDVTVLLSDNQKIKVEGVQILPDSMAYQDVNLNPLPSASDPTEIIAIQEHTLWENYPPKIPEEDVKPLPDASGYVVLSEPVIPEFIIVHTGVPDARAKNYWVPFKDYIKNVASCEIYATWPTETIKANVLAIISFTLNRVYTEWYRGKGKDFTITNSTAYDHAFTYGRNIFEPISLIVDDIFTNYVTKPDIKQPLFTQYCDGKNVSCPDWMTQWGSKSLGDQGYNAIDILKNFYGYDIYLTQAKSVAGVPQSYSGPALRVGSTGPAVRTIQEQLNKISNNYPAINKVAVNGTFDESTRKAVETFQKIFKLAADGIVGPATWYQISNIYVAVTRMAEGI